MNTEYRFFLWQFCNYARQDDVTALGSSGGKLQVVVADSTYYSVGDLVAYEEVLNGETLIQYSKIIFIDNTSGTIQLQVQYDNDPVAVVNWIALLERTLVHAFDFFAGVFTWDRNEVQYMRKTYEGKLRLKNDSKLSYTDYDLIISSIGVDCCCTFVLDIERKCSSDWELYYQGIFTAVDCEINPERCEVIFEFSPYDEYRCLLESGEPEINVLDIEDIETVNIDYSNSFEFIDCAATDPSGVILPWTAGFLTLETGCQVANPDAVASLAENIIQDSCITVGEGWMPYQTTVFAVDIGANLVQVTQKHFREVKYTFDVGGNPNPPPGEGWVNLGPAIAINGVFRHKWARRPYDGYYDTYNSLVQYPCSGPGTVVATIEIPGSSIEYNRARSLSNVLDYVAKSTCNQIEGIRSDFFDINPVGDSPDYVPGENYVTMAATQTNDLLVLQKSDFLTPDSSNAATKGLITWKDLIADLSTIFNLGWYIDTGGFIRIEHLKYFEAFQMQNQIDVTGVKANKSQRVFTYDKTNLPQREVWDWMDEVGEDFKGYPIKYNPNCTDKTQPEKAYSVENFTTDVDYMQSAPGDISSDGFVLIARNGTDAIQQTSPVSLQVLNNGPLAYVNLHPDYFTWGRVLPTGVMNNVQTSFDSSIRLRKTKDLILKECCQSFTFENSYVLAEAGNCLIQRVELSPKTNIYTFNLKTDANC